MIYLGFNLSNPWSRRFAVAYDRVIPVSKNKTIEISVYKNNSIIEFGFSLDGFKQNHRGLRFDIGLFGYNFELVLYDNRHYNQQ